MRGLVLLVALAAALAGAPADAHVRAEPAAASAAEGPTRILLLGDSVTQGSSGDWTWRYRLWQLLTRAEVDVDFVGPRDDLWDLRTDGPGGTSYAEPAFDRDHAARWGMWAGILDVPVATLMAHHQPDVVVVMLGVNDLLWSDDPASVAVGRVRSIVEQARASHPGVAVVLGEATQSWFTDVPDFNEGLHGLAEELTTPASPVTVAPVATAYSASEDTWDGSHPNARGEVRIAAGVADALAGVGVGGPVPRPLDLPAVGPVTAATLAVAGGDGRATLSWVGPDGATSHRLWRRDLAVSAAWSLDSSGLPRDGSRELVLANGHHYEFRLQPVKGDDLPTSEVYSNTVAVIPAASPPPPPPPPPPPSTLTAPRDVRAAAGRRCARVAWSRVSGAGGYHVQRWTGSRWRLAARTTSPRVVLTGLPVQRAWRLRVRAVRETTVGPATGIRVVRRSGHC